MYVPKKARTRQYKTLSLVAGVELVRLIDQEAERHGVSRNRMSNYILAKHFADNDWDIERLMFQ